MRIFITGATGYIGGAVTLALRKRGHDVAALVRPGAETGALRAAGVIIVSGDLASLASLRDQLGSYDTFVHTAQSRANPVVDDHQAIEVFTSFRRHFLYTSGVWVLGNTSGATEKSPVNPLELVAWRAAHEERVIGSGGTVLRPGCVYGGRQSLLASWFTAASNGEPLTIVGEGKNRWAMVELHELADLYVRIVEQQTRGVLHGIDDTDATIEECARAVSPGGTIVKIPLQEAREKMGPFADALAIDQKIDSAITRLETAWNPWSTFTSTVARQWEEWREATRA